MKFDIKKIYYYVICAVALFVLMWGIIDTLSASVGLLVFRPPAGYKLPQVGVPTLEAIEPFGGEFYQEKMLYDRLVDGIIRIIVPGIIFGYFSYKIKTLEGGEG